MEKSWEEMKQALRKNKPNELVDFFLNVGEIIQFYRRKRGWKIQDISQKVKTKYGADIHPSVISRIENKKMEARNTQIAYMFDVLDIHLEDVFPDKVLIIDVREYATNMKFQYLVGELKKFFSDEEIKSLINRHLETILHSAWKAVDSYTKTTSYRQVSEEE